MTSRIGAPDTDADRQLRDCLDQASPQNFVMVAGAGSGKTTSLVKALDHLEKTRGAALRRRSQVIACITYTEVAVGEIWGDVGNSSLFHVSTIHSFLWTIVHSFQNDIREWVADRISEKIATAEEKLANPRTRNRERPLRDIERYQAQRTALAGVRRFIYSSGSDYAAGVLGHDDILKIGPSLIDSRPLLRTLIARRFPYIFVDESQDTNPEIVIALRKVAESVPDTFCLGFFGDPMQKIYATGAGPIAPGPNWNSITKPENFRCPTSVLRVINRIRSEGDRLEQIRGRTAIRESEIVSVEGTARIFIVPSDSRNERLMDIRKWLSRANDDPHWDSDGDEGDVRVLVLVHRMAAHRLGFADLYAALNDHGDNRLKDGMLDGTAWLLRPFMSYLLPLAAAVRSAIDFDVLAILRVHCPLLSKERLLGQEAAALLTRLRNDVTSLADMLDGSSTRTIKDVLIFARERELAALDERFIPYLSGGPEPVGDEPNREADAVRACFASPAKQLWGYREYVEDESPFATQQGIKGAEFQRVLVILDDEESNYNQFSYGKYFGIEPLSDTDRENIRTHVDSVVDRTRRLFYVCCSRAVRDLAVVLFVPDVERAHDAILAKGFFEPSDVYTAESMLLS